MKIPLTNLDERTRGRLEGTDLIVFDGVCVLCSGFFKFMLRYDREKRFSFAVAQGDMGQACYAALDMPLDDFETYLVITDGYIYTDLDAFAAAMAGLGWPWRILSIVRWLPAWIKTPLYRLVARNRYRVFGRYETCMKPDDAVAERFVDGGLA